MIVSESTALLFAKLFSIAPVGAVTLAVFTAVCPYALGANAMNANGNALEIIPVVAMYERAFDLNLFFMIILPDKRIIGQLIGCF